MNPVPSRGFYKNPLHDLRSSQKIVLGTEVALLMEVESEERKETKHFPRKRCLRPWVKRSKKGMEGSMKSIVIEVIGAGGFFTLIT